MNSAPVKRVRLDVMPELAMLQSFYSGPLLRAGLLNEKPRPVCAGGVLESCVPDPTAHCRRPPPHARRPLREMAQFLVGSQSAWKGSLGTLSVCWLTGFIQTQVFQRDNGKIFICAKMSQRSRFSEWRAKTKNPAKARFLSALCGWLPPGTLCYVNAKSIRVLRNTRNFGTNFDVLEYG